MADKPEPVDQDETELDEEELDRFGVSLDDLQIESDED